MTPAPRSSVSTRQARLSRRKTSSGDAASRLRPWLLGMATALIVSRTLVPTESAASGGDGLPWVILWLVLGAAWFATGFRSGRFELRGGWTEAALIALWLAIAASGIRATFHGAPRPAINMTWEWTALLAIVLVLRQLLRSQREARALVVVMLALAAAESLYGLHQYFISLPETRRMYQEDPDAMLREIGQWSPPDSPERLRFEQRLASTEPLGTFALTNSLAGFLATWLVLGLGAVYLWVSAENAGRWRAWLAAAVTLVPMAAVLVLTKSRSAYLAALIGVAALVFALGGSLATRLRMFAVAGMIGLVVGVVGFLADGLDREVLSEAGLSLTYRLEYWRSSLAMIAEHPWLGVGPGNFQDNYTRYKLPEASEEVADPHNFVVELWATGGSIALAALLAAAVALAVTLWRRRATRPVESGQEIPPADAYRSVLIGGLAGFVVAYAFGWVFASVIEVPLSLGAMLGGGAAAGLVAAMWWDWIEKGRLTVALCVVAMIVLLVNFSAAGGISYAGVSSSLWLLAAIALCLSMPSSQSVRADARLATLGIAGALLLLILACYVTGYRPVLAGSGAMLLARAEPRLAEQHFQAAADADRHAYEPRMSLAELYYQRWAASPDEATWQQFEAALADALARRPASAVAQSRAGRLYFEAFERRGDQRALDAAVEHFAATIDRYPASAEHRAWLSIALKRAGQIERASSEAQIALDLHETTPHIDRKLTPALHETMSALLGGSN